MNFIDDVEGERVLVELKYCERCGGLWLRPQKTDGVYCAACRACLAAMPDPGKAPARKVRRRIRVRKADGRTVRIDCLQGVAAAEVWA
jgi:Zn-finger nucleic acid-binding protein